MCGLEGMTEKTIACPFGQAKVAVYIINLLIPNIISPDSY